MSRQPVFALPLLLASLTFGKDPLPVPGLQAPAQVTRDPQGVAHVQAANEHDLWLLQGWVHAEDRLFQMDLLRRQAAGTLAELVGPAGLESDVQLRTLGIRRSAERTERALAPRTRAVLEAYARGVNARIAGGPLPPEYAALELTRIPPWTVLDSVLAAKLLAFDRSFFLELPATLDLLQYRATGHQHGFDGTALYFEDVWRSAPFDPTTTLPPRPGSGGGPAFAPRGSDALSFLDPAAEGLMRRTLERMRRVPALRNALAPQPVVGSNEWVVSGRHTRSGAPLLAGDPHSFLAQPNFFHQVHLTGGAIDLIGLGLPGVPAVIIGHNRFVAWTLTVHYADLTDTYQERVEPDATSPSGWSTVHRGAREHVLPVPEVFRQNQPGNQVPDDVVTVPPGGPVPPATLIVPRRNQGPIIDLDPQNGVALSVQYTGFSATQELEATLRCAEARSVHELQDALRFFDFGSFHWASADVHGNIGYFVNGELPLREDLEAGRIAGAPPGLVRDGTGGNEWLPEPNPPADQSIPYRVLPADELPRAVNPPEGWLVNANNDPLGLALDNDPYNQLRPGGGLYYLGNSAPGTRAGQVTRRLRALLARGAITRDDFEALQADVELPDAHVFVPHLVRALARAWLPGAAPELVAERRRPGVLAAVLRLALWDRTAPTGIREGYDASDDRGVRFPPAFREELASVAATIYSVWRGRVLHHTLDAPLRTHGLALPEGEGALAGLRRLLERFPETGGRGASGLDFFAVPGVARAEDRRDVLLLRSLGEALEQLAGEPFAPAFHRSTRQDDWRWGRLHRAVLTHPLGDPFGVPPALGAFPPPLADLPGIPADGGLDTVDQSPHPLRAADANGFMFFDGPSLRILCSAQPGWDDSTWSLAGGASGVPGHPRYVDQLPAWLTNDGVPMLFRPEDVRRHATQVLDFVPGP
jgi:penicillin amidase